MIAINTKNYAGLADGGLTTKYFLHTHRAFEYIIRAIISAYGKLVLDAMDDTRPGE